MLHVVITIIIILNTELTTKPNRTQLLSQSLLTRYAIVRITQHFQPPIFHSLPHYTEIYRLCCKAILHDGMNVHIIFKIIKFLP